jgi:hypothetical protein
VQYSIPPSCSKFEFRSLRLHVPPPSRCSSSLNHLILRPTRAGPKVSKMAGYTPQPDNAGTSPALNAPYPDTQNETARTALKERVKELVVNLNTQVRTPPICDSIGDRTFQQYKDSDTYMLPLLYSSPLVGAAL